MRGRDRHIWSASGSTSPTHTSLYDTSSLVRDGKPDRLGSCRQHRRQAIQGESTYSLRPSSIEHAQHVHVHTSLSRLSLSSRSTRLDLNAALLRSDASVRMFWRRLSVRRAAAVKRAVAGVKKGGGEQGQTPQHTCECKQCWLQGLHAVCCQVQGLQQQQQGCSKP